MPDPTAIASFPPLAGDRPVLLVLGSIPGSASLQAQQYYAHPRNAFWPIMAAFFQFSAAAPYKHRVANLTDRGIALWDLLARANRKGSLDSAIVADTQVVNPIGAWLSERPSVKGVLLNGTKATQLFNKHFAASAAAAALKVYPLPSTSPAYAALVVKEKQAQWHAVMSNFY